MTQIEDPSAAHERQYHTYTTHRIPWFIRAMWILFWVGGVWYVVKFAIPMAKNYF